MWKGLQNFMSIEMNFRSRSSTFLRVMRLHDVMTNNKDNIGRFFVIGNWFDKV